jgi:arylsulfatase A
MGDHQSGTLPSTAAAPFPLYPALFVTVAVITCTVYANLSFAVTDPADYRFFPPFRPHFNANCSTALGGECYQIAKSMVAGEGFANPFKERTGPTAWSAPVRPVMLAGLLWAFDGNRAAVAAVMIVVQNAVLIGTWFLVVAVFRRTVVKSQVSPWAAAAAYVGLLVCDFHSWFQSPTDGWLVLLALDLIVVGSCWWRPLDGFPKALAWGLLGGISALINPIVGFTWGTLAVVTGCRQRARSRLLVTMLAAALTLSPWTIRNYLVFGRLIPVKSNAAYELYQSQCLQPDGLIRHATFASHPHMLPGRERQQYKDLGETAFLDAKRQRFWQSVSADPMGFIKRVADRFFGVTLWYVPFDRASEARRPWLLWVNRLIYPLPFLGLLVLACSAGRERLHGVQWAVMGVYVFYLLPYVGISYYDRYMLPLLAVKALLAIWAADRLLHWMRRPTMVDEPEKTKTRTGRQDSVAVWKIAAVCLLAVLALAGAWWYLQPPRHITRGPANRSSKPNIIVILADDFGYECVGAYGGKSYKTPNLDKLAASGMRFENGYAQPLCTPTRVQLMTGRYNVRNYINFGTLDRWATTFAHLLKMIGYCTCMVGKWQLGEDFALPAHFGFDEYCLWQLTRRPPRYANPGLEINGKEINCQNGEYGPDIVNDYAMDFLKRKKDQPFLLYYTMMLPHSPFQPTPDSPDWNPRAMGERINQHDRHFGEMTTYMDKLIGKLVARLDELKLRDNTVIIFLGDNGTDVGISSRLGDKLIQGGKGSTTSAGMHVPLIVNWPGTVPAGKTCRDLVDSTDLLPTLCDVTGATLPADLKIDGRSFAPQLRGDKGRPRDWYYCWYARDGGPVATREFAATDRYKLYRTGELYDYQADPLETESLSDPPPEAAAMVRMLRGVLEEYKNARPAEYKKGDKR